MKIKNYVLGFTLIELMVVVTISMLLLGGLALSLSKFYSQEKVNQAAGQLVSLLTMARNLATTNQVPAGFSDDLNYVGVTINNEGIVAAFPYNLNSGVGPSYFAKDITEAGIGITSSGVRFSAGNGKLVNIDGTPVAAGTTVTIIVNSGNEEGNKQITISAMGVIK